MNLRKEICRGEKKGDDKPVEPFFKVTYTVSPNDWGVEAVYNKTDEQGSYVWDNQKQTTRRLENECAKKSWCDSGGQSTLTKG
jgi:hypothetical protein